MKTSKLSYQLGPGTCAPGEIHRSNLRESKQKESTLCNSNPGNKSTFLFTQRECKISFPLTSSSHQFPVLKGTMCEKSRTRSNVKKGYTCKG
uniref:Uncharacterized protein n=1 Tax=Gopherus agassizii TaxID=38772 RepID=A0A452HCD7_9SAUR